MWLPPHHIVKCTCPFRAPLNWKLLPFLPFLFFFLFFFVPLLFVVPKLFERDDGLASRMRREKAWHGTFTVGVIYSSFEIRTTTGNEPNWKMKGNPRINDFTAPT